MAVSPTQVVLNFDENVEIEFGSISIFNEKADPVDIGAPHHSPTTDHSIEASVPHLADGTYVLSWHVISADSHPVHGVYHSRSESRRSTRQGVEQKIEASSGGNKTVGVVFAIVCAAEFAGIALLLGAVAFAAAIRPTGKRRSRADALVWVGWILLFVATIVGLLLQGPYAAGRSISDIFHTAIVSAVLQTRFGHLAEIRLVLLLAALPLLFVARKSWRPRWWWWALATPIGILIAATPGLSRPRRDRNLHAVRSAARHLARRGDEHLARWFGGAGAGRDRSRSRCSPKLGTLLPRRVDERHPHCRIGRVRRMAPGRMVGRCVQGHDVRPPVAGEDRGVHRADRARGVEPQRRAPPPAGDVERRGRDRDRRTVGDQDGARRSGRARLCVGPSVPSSCSALRSS